MEEEGLQDTENKLIHIGKPIEMDDEKFKEQLKRLEAAYKTEADNMKDIVAEIVPTYKRKRVRRKIVGIPANSFVRLREGLQSCIHIFSNAL